jgi:putative restriction endonuclease
LAGTNWSETVEFAVARLAGRHGDSRFTLQQLVDEELPRIVRETGSRGLTPEATLRRELQELRDRDGIEFLGRGQYRLRAAPLALPALPALAPGKCVFATGAHTADEPDRFYRFAPRWLEVAARAIGQWVIYRQPPAAGPRGFHAVARVEQIVRDPAHPDALLALIVPGSYLEFGRDVLGPPNGDDPVQPIPDEAFDRILALGLIEEDELLPREEALDARERVHDPQAQEPFLGPVERETVLTNRKVRDRQFRKRVLDAYECRCALTGMRLINGGGRAEVQAAHIIGVEHGGSDKENNGIALSGTVHWMFDRGLVSLSDSGDILLSGEIGDVASVERLICPDRRARLPANESLRPHRRYLAWHREYHRFAA